MKKALGLLSLFCYLFMFNFSFAAPGAYFNLTQSGAVLNPAIKAILCLAPNYNCQNYILWEDGEIEWEQGELPWTEKNNIFFNPRDHTLLRLCVPRIQTLHSRIGWAQNKTVS